jgi:hypothetical protein
LQAHQNQLEHEAHDEGFEPEDEQLVEDPEEAERKRLRKVKRQERKEKAIEKEMEKLPAWLLTKVS